MVFDYSKLKGRIVEKCGTMAAFCKEAGYSRAVISNRLRSVSFFSQPEMLRICSILEIPREDASEFFFTPKIEKSQSRKGA